MQSRFIVAPDLAGKLARVSQGTRRRASDWASSNRRRFFDGDGELVGESAGEVYIGRVKCPGALAAAHQHPKPSAAAFSGTSTALRT